MDSDKACQVKQNRMRIRQSLKLIQSKKSETQSPTQKKSENSAVTRRRRKTSECLKEFNSISVFKDQAIKESFQTFFQLGEKIGEGCQSVVYKCEEKLTGKQYAVKVTKQRDLELMENMRYCYQILKQLRHQSIVKGHYLFVSQKKLTCHMVCDYCSFPTLKRFILDQKKNKKTKDYFTEEVVAPIIQSLLDCLAYLQDKGVCHRDIKPQNILYDPLSQNIKIIDFQIAKIQRYTHQKLQLWSNTGTLHYRAPQTFSNRYGLPVDVWSVGIICYQMLVGHLPFKSSYCSDTVKEILEKEIDFEELDVTQTAKIFLKKILEKNPEKRMSPMQALSSPWLLKNSKRCSLKSPSRLNSSFEESQQIQEFSMNENKFYDEDKHFTFSTSEDIGVRFCE